MGDILIKRSILIINYARRELHGAGIHMHDENILAGAQNCAPPFECEVVQARGCIVSLGLFNTHHFY